MSALVTGGGRSIRLAGEIARGGEGAVFGVEGRPDVVAKVYHQAASPEKAEKIAAMAAGGTERLRGVAAWPSDTLHERAGAPVRGFLMRRVARHKDIHVVYGPKTRLRDYPEATYRFLIAVAANVARAFAVVHEHGHVIGDVNQGGVCVSPQGTVTLVDCDSFQIASGTRVFGCDVGIPVYQPPELQSVASYRGLARTANYDCFGLAVLLFQTLFLARHPYSGAFSGAGDMPIERAIGEFRFAYGHDAALRHMRQPPGSLGLGAITPKAAMLFEAAFLEQGARGQRPSARDWVEALDELAGELTDCPKNAGHAYYRALARCPLCELEAKSGVLLFLPPRPASAAAPAVRLDELWHDLIACFERARVPSPQEFAPAVPSLPVPNAPTAPRRRVAEQRREAEAAARSLAERQEELEALPKRVIEYRRGRKRFWASAGLVLAACVVTATFLSPFLLVFGIIAGAALPLLLRPPPAASEGELHEQIANQARAVDRAREALGVAEAQAEEAELAVAAVVAAQARASEIMRELEKERGAEAAARLRKHEVEARRLYAILQGVDARRAQRLQAFERTRRERQLARHLDRFEVKDCKLKGFGIGLLTTLVSNGIETAGDVDGGRLRQLPGFGPARIEALLQWRRSHEATFRFNPSDALDERERDQIERELALERAADLEALRQLAARAKADAAPLSAKLQAMRARAVQIGEELRVAQEKVVSLKLFST